MSYIKSLVAATLIAASQLYSQTPEEKLKSASQVDIKEQVFSFGKKYDINVNGQKIATVEGKNINWWEDRFILKTVDGKVLASEKENKRFLSYNRSASFYDGSGNLTGTIAEDVGRDFFKLNHIFHIFDANHKEIGKTEKKFFTVLDKIDLYDAEGNTDYKIKENANLFTDSYVVNVIDNKSSIPLEKVILLTCIEDAIKDAENSSSSDDD